MANPVGRPTTYTPEVLTATEEYFENFEAWYESTVDRQLKDGTTETRMERLPNPPPSVLDLHRYLKSKGITVSRWSLYDWSETGNSCEIPAFSQAVKRGITSLYPEVLQENAILGKYAPAFSIFAAKNRMGWHDKQEVDHKHVIEPFILKNESGETLITLGSKVANNPA
jgi:hypothetical protein